MAAGALKPRKEYHTTLEALPAVRERYPDVQYYLVGDDQDRKYVAGLRETIDRLDLGRNATIRADRRRRGTWMPCTDAPMRTCSRPRTAAGRSRGSA